MGAIVYIWGKSYRLDTPPSPTLIVDRDLTVRISDVDSLSAAAQIAEIASSRPDSIALSCNGRHLRYGELERQSARFASHLVSLGVGTGSVVAICLERSFDWIVSALGIMRAGAAYLPLDPAWPDSRLRFAVNDSGAAVVVGRSGLLDRLQLTVRCIDPDRDREAIESASHRVRKSAEPEDLAYVIYTSGSSGAPKGVEITHANLGHLIRWHRETFRVTAQDRTSHLAGLGFDAAVWEIWPNLCSGSTLCLAGESERASSELLQQWIIQERITISFVPTVLAARLLEMEWPGSAELRLLLTGGDKLHHGPSAPLPFDVVNNYGPAECTVVATSGLLGPGAKDPPPIGFPIAGASVYLLDDAGEPVPEGAVGEIYIGGAGVGRGYRNAPELTVRAFLRDPFAASPGGRMYRTGDYGSRLPNGEIQFHGRSDRQVKIRGQRVELDEISSVLSQHPAIEFATVTAAASENGDTRLTAYFIAKDQVPVPAKQGLQKHLTQSLPDYMVPAAFVRLHELPLSPNGKIDLSLLPEAPAGLVLEGISAQHSLTATEERLLAIAQELLEGHKLEKNDNFFLAGGHSLLGMQLIMRVRAEFDVNLSLQQLFESPSVEGLAATVDILLAEDRLKDIWSELLQLEHVQPNANFFDLGGSPELVTALQERIASDFGEDVTVAELFHNSSIRQQAMLVLRHLPQEPSLPAGVYALHLEGKRNSIFWIHTLNVDLARALGEDQPFFFVTFSASDLEALGEDPPLEQMAALLVKKILATQPQGPYTIGGVCIASVLAYEIARQLHSAGREVPALILLDAPSQPYLESFKSIAARLKYPRELVKRVTGLGLRRSFVNFCSRKLRRIPASIGTHLPRTEKSIAHEMIEDAAFSYYPEGYDGKVLLLLGADRDPHLNFLPQWKALITRDLHTYYVDGQHRRFITPENVKDIADIVTHVLSISDERSTLSA